MGDHGETKSGRRNSAGFSREAQLIRRLTAFLKDSSGAILPLAAVMMPVILGMAAVGVDASLWMMQQRNLQTAADAAVIAGAWETANGNSGGANAAALGEAQNNGYTGNSIALVYGTDDQDRTTITTTIEENSYVFLSSVLFGSNVRPAVTAASVIMLPTTDFCLLSLDPSADGAITAVGNVSIDSGGCGMAINSNSASALDLTGNVDINMGDVSIVGNDSVNGSVNFQHTGLTTGAARTPDPYADLQVPDHPAICDHNNLSLHADTTLNPGVYCGGLSITGGTITFNAGVYYMVDGDFTVNGNAILTGDEVSFVFTSSGAGGSYGTVQINGGGNGTFSAPAEGSDMEGVVFYQDREAPGGQSCGSILGNAEVNIDGAVYFPSNCLDFGGNSASAAGLCTRLIASTIRLHGTPNLSNDCEDSAARDISQYAVKLVL